MHFFHEQHLPWVFVEHSWIINCWVTDSTYSDALKKGREAWKPSRTGRYQRRELAEQAPQAGWRFKGRQQHYHLHMGVPTQANGEDARPVGFPHSADFGNLVGGLVRSIILRKRTSREGRRILLTPSTEVTPAYRSCSIRRCGNPTGYKQLSTWEHPSAKTTSPCTYGVGAVEHGTDAAPSEGTLLRSASTLLPSLHIVNCT